MTPLAAFGAAIITLPLEAVVGAITVAAMAPAAGGGAALAFGVLACLLALAVRAAKKDAHARRAARLVAPPF